VWSAGSPHVVHCHVVLSDGGAHAHVLELMDTGTLDGASTAGKGT
jgi:hypothetical protein